MESYYLGLILLLSLLAVGDLIVGVSNDAVNFLNSAIGSKAISFRNLMILASIGILCGAVFSSGMMEVARKGIFNPSAFYFNEIISIFLAVMMTDILLLDFFNSFGMPTSTTVSIVFELLGAAVIMSIIKIVDAGNDLSTLGSYINTEKAAQIILGILLSVVIAFSIGALVQWLARMLWTYKFEQKSPLWSALFGGVSLTAITTFILIKGIKGTPFANTSFDLLGGQTILSFLEGETLVVNGSLFIFWFVFSWLIQGVLKIDIYKVIIGIGTFALALAFAGNDLVNFIGVPIAAFQSYEAWVSSGMHPDFYEMSALAKKVPTPSSFLLLSGAIMIATLWTSSKARAVVKTSIDLSNQQNTRERFKANFVARQLVNSARFFNRTFVGITPKSVLQKIDKTYASGSEATVIDPDAPAFDKLRASINLVVAAVLISFATSLKLPLSTTYVTFMVAMGSSLADRAWGADSAVYRVAGVINVIGGWFFTAFSAFTLGGIVVFAIHKGGIWSIGTILFVIVFLLLKNYQIHRNRKRKNVAYERILRLKNQNTTDVIRDSGHSIAAVMQTVMTTYGLMVRGLTNYDLAPLWSAKRESRKLNRELEELRNGVFYFIRSIDTQETKAATFYVNQLGALQDVNEDLYYLTKLTHLHVYNSHQKLSGEHVENLLDLEESLQRLLQEAKEAFAAGTDDSEYQDVFALRADIYKLLEEKIQWQIEQTAQFESSPRNASLYFNILLKTKDLVRNQFELIDTFYSSVQER